MSAELEDELVACNSIYPDCIRPVVANSRNLFLLQLPDRNVQIQLAIPTAYPQEPITISSATGIERSVAEKVLCGLSAEGTVCLYPLIEGLLDIVPESTCAQDQKPTNGGSEPADNPESSGSPPWAASEAIVDRKSTFVAHALSISSTDQVRRALNDLYRNKKIQKATHNIYAYRFENEHGNTVQDNDDDGETAAGSRLAHLLQLMQASNTLVVVSRWYGGIQLGPDRFRHINAVARQAVTALRSQEDQK